MVDDVFIYLVRLPDGINEFVSPCADGNYTVYIDSRLSYAQQRIAYDHAIRHIQNGDFDMDCTDSVQEIETRAHKRA